MVSSVSQHFVSEHSGLSLTFFQFQQKVKCEKTVLNKWINFKCKKIYNLPLKEDETVFLQNRVLEYLGEVKPFGFTITWSELRQMRADRLRHLLVLITHLLQAANDVCYRL